MKKRILSAILAAAMLASLASCSGSGEQTTTAAATAAPTQETTTTEAPEPELTVSCKDLTDAVVTAVEPMTVWLDPADEGSISMIKDVMGYDTDLFSEYSIVMNAMSVHLIEIVVVKPADGKADDVKKAFEDRKAQLIENVAFYPDQLESAEQTIVGSAADDKIIYLLCGPDTAAMEKALTDAVK